MSWEKVKLGEIANCIQPGPFGSQLHSSDYADEGTPIIMPKDMIGGRISHQDLIRVPDEHLQRLKRHQVYDGDLMVARKGDVRKCVYITENENGWLTGSDCLKVSLDKGKCYPKYIYYQLRSPFIGRWLETISIGATMPSLNTGLLSGIEISLPTIDAQIRIADVLSTYDDLIENNQMQIKLLEEAAQRLYKEWFVDLRFPGYETIPIIDGIPDGWEDKSMEEICDSVGGGTPSTKNDEYYRDGKIKWVTPTDITRKNGLILLDTEKKITEEGLQHSSAKIVPPYTILMTSRASVGFFGLCEYEVCTNQGFISCVPYKENTRFYLLYNLMNRVDEIRGKASGSTFLEISKKNFRVLRIILPADNVLDAFTKVVAPMVRQMEMLTKAIATLQEARDRLIPKLMNREIVV